MVAYGNKDLHTYSVRGCSQVKLKTVTTAVSSCLKTNQFQMGSRETKRGETYQIPQFKNKIKNKPVISLVLTYLYFLIWICLSLSYSLILLFWRTFYHMRGLNSTTDCQRMPHPGQEHWVDALQHKASPGFSGNSLCVCACVMHMHCPGLTQLESLLHDLIYTVLPVSLLLTTALLRTMLGKNELNPRGGWTRR